MKNWEWTAMFCLAGLLLVLALLVSCRWGGAKIEADVPIYGNAAIVVQPVEIDDGSTDSADGEDDGGTD